MKPRFTMIHEGNSPCCKTYEIKKAEDLRYTIDHQQPLVQQHPNALTGDATKTAHKNKCNEVLAF